MQEASGDIKFPYRIVPLNIYSYGAYFFYFNIYEWSSSGEEHKYTNSRIS